MYKENVKIWCYWNKGEPQGLFEITEASSYFVTFHSKQFDFFFSLLQYVQLSIKDQEIREKLTSSTHDYFLFYKNMIFRIFMIWHITFECYFNFTSYLKHRLSISWECFNILWSQLFVDLKMSTVTKCLLPQMFLLQ